MMLSRWCQPHCAIARDTLKPPLLKLMTQLTTERRRVLVVDDDSRVLDLVVELLTQEGHEVSAAKDGGQALNLAIACEPDLVVSDVSMPVLDGIELCRRLKQHPQTASIPVLLMSGSRVSADDS